MSIEVKGLQESLRELRRLDPELRKEIGRDIQRLVKPVAAEINASIPVSPPLSGMAHSGRTGWTNRRTVSVRTDTRRPRRSMTEPPGTSTVAVVKIVTRGAPVAITDMAGRAGGSQSRRDARYQRPGFASALTAAIGRPASRYVWADLSSKTASLEDELRRIVRRVEDEATKAQMKIKWP
jgi:hypothetical protein